MNKIRWGILGAAKIAREYLIPAIQLSVDGVVTALASRDAVKGAALCQRFNIPHPFESYDDLLATTDIDAVYIPLPNAMHVEWTRRAIAAGKHVLCDKPLALRAEEIDDLIAARDHSGRVVGEGFMVVHHPQWQHVKNLLTAGHLGTLRMVESSFAFFNVDPSNIRNQPELGGGALRDIGVYPVVTTRFATGREPLSAQATIDWDQRFGVDRFATCLLDFGDFQLSFYCSTQAAHRQHVAFHGDKGWMRLDAPFNAGVYDIARVTTRMTGSTTVEEVIFPQANQYQLMIENFHGAIRGRETLAFPLESSRANQRVIDMIYAAATPYPHAGA
jgi:predicted dehydrogenase